jgi:hypothetical protein
MVVFVKLCIFLGIGLAVLGLRWLLLGPPDPTDRNDRGGWTPWG